MMIPIAIFASGTGTNATKIIEHFKDHTRIKVALVVSNKRDAGVLDIARQHDIPTLLIKRDSFYHSNEILFHLEEVGIKCIILAGFLWLIPSYLVRSYPGKMINIHPALLPKYGGKGMYGMRVHEAVHRASEKESGITIHFVNEHYDEGAIIFQVACPLTNDDTPEDIRQKVQKLEHTYFPRIAEKVILKEKIKSLYP